MKQVKPYLLSLNALILLCTIGAGLSIEAQALQMNKSLGADDQGNSLLGNSYQVENSDGPIIDPNLERRDISEFDIDSENIEVGAFVGVISIEDFESSVVYGARAAYHINEHLFIEATYGLTEAGDTSFEVLSGGAPFLTDDERDYTYYDVSAGYNINGELFLTDNMVFNTDFYLTLGAGSTDFGGDERFTISAGAGYRLLLTDYFALRLDVRDHIFESDIIGEEKNVHNLTYTLSTSFFF